ncbi:MAG: tetratricopeptide repeat protein [Phycisphaerae bacterium]|nr:tetratricopeptide repeat protein [Phycisphaerae bacterium]NIP52306.1 tetratricopeptide repeat protein [Phycisphaerae bacterium]NIS51269.1 tetratricopeptide repeat protein [Phycisphaerae bacterium]NIU09781.1 tetratricopeptide repeat protein [Phycisphaerae bacterium]NIU56569.1 tetratricopeptide repeat protein [Phycisphaerae bacterium]
MNIPLHKNKSLLAYGFLVITALAVYWPVLKCEFVKYDDDKYVTQNPNVKRGITYETVIWAFTTPHYHMWHPLTSLTHLLDYQLFGLNPTWHHLTSLLFHIASTLLLFGILKRMTAAFWPSLFVAAAFALHPLNVESVAWVSERKNVLSTFFWMLTIAAYIRYTDRLCLGRFLSVVLVFALATMTKPMVVTLPFVLLLLDYWPLQRLKFKPAGREQDLEYDLEQDLEQAETEQDDDRGIPLWRLLVEKIPLFVLVAALSAVTFIAQKRGGVMSGWHNVPLKYRLSNALVSYVTYISKMVWPVRLAVFYPHPFNKLPIWQIAASALVLLVVSVAVLWFARRRKYLTVGWLWYLGILVPVIGIVQVGSQAMADRYTYLPFIGLFIMVSWGLYELLAGWRYRRIILGPAALAVLLTLAVCTRLQLRHWRNNKALFEHAINVTENNFVMNNNYANVLKDIGEVEKAVEHFGNALRIRPNSPEIYNNLGIALRKLNRSDDAIMCYRKALELKAYFPEARFNLAAELTRQGKIDEAIEQYRMALKLRPDDVETISGLGFALAQKGRFDEAIGYYQKALELKPGNIITRGRLGLALAGIKKYDEAIEQFQIVLKANPKDLEMHCNVGILLAAQGKTEEAIKAYRRALEIDPNYTKALNLLKAAEAARQNR